MQPPLPEVPKVAPPSTAKPAFLGLNVVVGVDVISTILSVFFYVIFLKPDPEIPILAMQIIYGLISVAYAVIVYFLWRGYNWARWVTIVFSGLALVTIFSPDVSVSRFPGVERIYTLSSCFWSVGEGVWLLLPGVARHFKSKAGNTLSEINAG